MKQLQPKIITSIVAFSLSLGCLHSEAAEKGRRTDALESTLWNQSEWISAAKWISAVEAPVVHDGNNGRAADGASWFVSKIKNGKKVQSAKWMTSGLGVYELYVNGHLIGSEILKPGFTHYGKTKRSFTYDVTDAISTRKGAENTLSVQVTPGWWGDRIITPGGHDGMRGKKVAFRGVLELTFDDGSKEYHGTNCSDWKAGIAGPVKHASIFDGEEYDAREQLGHEVAHTLLVPEKNTEFNGRIIPSDGAEVYLREDLAMQPRRTYVWNGVTGASDEAFGTVVITREYAPGEEITIKPGEKLVVDFGQNCAAVPWFEFNAKEGTQLKCLPAELLNDGNGAKKRGMDGPEGSCHRLNLRTPETGMTLDYTFADNKDFVTYHPRCSFFGYRYMTVVATDEVRIKSMKSIPVSSITKEMEIGSITTGNALVNQLISNTLWGQRSNYLSVTTDCPQRNERLGWTADTQVFAETGTFFANTGQFFHKWMGDMRDTQSDLGGFPGVAPASQYGAEPTSMMRLGWADAGVIVPWVVWKQFGDTRIVDDNWEAMEKYIIRKNY